MKRIFLTLIFTFSCFVVFADDITALMSKAESGNATAQYDLACYYLNNTEANHKEVLRWLRKASKQNYEKANQLIKFLIQDGHNSWGDYRLTPKYNFGIMSLTEAVLWLAAAIMIIVSLPLGLIFARILTDRTFRHCS